MAHEVENMMYVGATPWHGLGIQLPENPSIDDAIKAAGLDWLVRLEKLSLADGRTVESQATVRESDNSILGVVGPDYRILQNSEAFAFFKPFLDSGLVTLETAGSLRAGKRVFVLAKVKGVTGDVVQGDPVESYVLLSNSHDGTMSIRVGFTPIRVVCANTLRLAHNDNASKLIRIKHTAGSKDALDVIQRIMQVSTQEFHATIDQFKFLASKECSETDLNRYVKLVMGIPEAELNSEKGNRVLAEVIPLFHKGRGNDLPGVRNTYWGAYNAFNEYLGYIRGKSQDTRLDSLWFGSGAELNQRALNTATELARAA